MFSNDASLLHEEAFMTALAVLGVAFVVGLLVLLTMSRGMRRTSRAHHVTSDGTMAFGDGGSADCGSDGGGGCDGGGGGGD